MELSEKQIEKNKARVMELLAATKRPGIDHLIKWLDEKTDFFIAPASAKYHLATQGGLVQHSLYVYERLLEKIRSGLVAIPDDTLIITALLHDLCKINFYVRETRNVKEGTKTNSYGKVVANWVEKEVWGVRDPFPVGHGEKSCYYIQCFIRLSPEEYAMIRLHMGPEKNTFPDYFAEAAGIYPSVAALHAADLEAAFIVETRKEAEDMTSSAGKD